MSKATTPRAAAAAEDDEVDRVAGRRGRVAAVVLAVDPAVDEVAARRRAGSRARPLTVTRSPASTELAAARRRPPCRSWKTPTPSALATTKPTLEPGERPAGLRARRRERRSARPARRCVTRSPLGVLEPGVEQPRRRRLARSPPSPAPLAAPLEVEPQVAAADLGRVADRLHDRRRRSASPGGSSARPSAISWVTRTIVLPLGFHLVEGVGALLLEGGVADRQHLVDQQDVGVGPASSPRRRAGPASPRSSSSASGRRTPRVRRTR